MRRSLPLLAAGLLLGAAPASATSWVFACPPSCAHSDGAGTMLGSEIRFDDASLDLEWTASFAPNAEGRTPQAFWAVFTDGASPRQATGELAILYGDGSSRDVWAYRYDPELSRSSWKDPGGFIQSFPGAVSFAPDPGPNPDGIVSMHLLIPDLSSILPPALDPGVGFGPTIGLSSQFFSNGGSAVYASQAGYIVGFDIDGETSYGRHHRATQPMPEPHAALAFAVGLGIVGWGIRRAQGRARLRAT